MNTSFQIQQKLKLEYEKYQNEKNNYRKELLYLSYLAMREICLECNLITE